MSTNKYRKHVLVLPEDDANRQIANGFLLNPDLNIRVIRILPPSGGWVKAIEAFNGIYLKGMRLYDKRMFILLIDFDNDQNRFKKIYEKIPVDLHNRVFLLGSLSEPENLKKQINLKSLEEIGKALAKDCVNETDTIWSHSLLLHNKNELERIINEVRPFLFN